MVVVRIRLLGIALFGLLGCCASGFAATVIVNDSGDLLHSPGCATTGTGACTLRDAITFANANPGADVIDFDIPGSGVHTISPTASLPSLDDAAGVTIDGYSQPGATANTLLRGDDAELMIEIDGFGIPSGFQGMLTLFAGNNTIRGLVLNRYGVSSGIAIESSGNSIAGNFIGTDVTGMNARPSRSGIIVSGGGNTIGGPDPGSRNIIVANDLNTMDLVSSGNVIQGNYVGTNREGTASLGGLFHGIAVDGDANVIGGLNVGEGNLVSGNATSIGDGILILSSGNTVAGNFIGTDRDGVLPVPNGGNGISCGYFNPTAGPNLIFGNTIAYNTLAGIQIGNANDTMTFRNQISQNSIWSNGGLGIDLGDLGVLLNDVADSDAGANNLQNYPVLNAAITNGVHTTVSGFLNSVPIATFELEFFASASCDPSGNGPGQMFLGSTTVTTGLFGSTIVSAVLSLPATGVVTATATDADGNTSEFSPCVTVQVPTPWMTVDGHSLAGSASNLNFVLEPGEAAVVEPIWKNTTPDPLSLTGTATNFTGPAGPTYTIVDASADYGTIPPDAAVDCYFATHDCYTLEVAGARPMQHWDAQFDEQLSDAELKTWVVHVGGSFQDLSSADPFFPYVENLFHHGITGGCAVGLFCPGADVTRAEISVFLLKSLLGSDYVPLPASGIFADVPAEDPFAPWIEDLYNRGITSGCLTNPLRFCPERPVTRAEIAVLLLRTLFGVGYVPPMATGVFDDVSADDPFAPWIEDLFARRITGGCQAVPPLYCPNGSAARGQAAVFLVRTFGLLLYGP